MTSRLKWSFIVGALGALLIAAYLLHAKFVTNPRVVEEILNRPEGARAGIVMLLTFPDGRQIPVNYLREGNKVFAGADGGWWRAVRDGGARVSMVIRGETLSGHAVAVLDDSDYTHDVFSRLRPTVPTWLPDWLNGKLVVITLDVD